MATRVGRFPEATLLFNRLDRDRAGNLARRTGRAKRAVQPAQTNARSSIVVWGKIINVDKFNQIGVIGTRDPLSSVARPTIGVDSAQPTSRRIPYGFPLSDRIIPRFIPFLTKFHRSRVAATGGFQSLLWADQSLHSFMIVLPLTASMDRPIRALIPRL